ncbi:MAG: Stp1/IreP family PP2C-type Ser/Thr phosphatase [Clostridia bacterium]|nr:Stp1/IreP family PP2C-type Ser/Thr phosphatase [Clostridia bacterium]MBQ8333000.1 Stp1/IreP family PP2C-type Ser/Thr phosphatase [Clostridia bacterium]MBQ8368902.1 Stp1/IreP family PP2C-type Ser/Thr phosphatase [Clostridia bacterium]MBQ8513316.1 Stp1/IreP family PP2C-type Ser/Thr phosphatase [Clostridia bacterium]
MLFYGKTDVGRRRSENQDNFIIKRYASDVLFAVVCDGMGGANGGSTASSVAMNAFADCLDAAEREHPAFYGMSEDDLLDLLSEAATEANRCVYRLAQTSSALSGMGTTLVGCIVAGEHAYIVNVGDSRLYAIMDGFIEQVTHDHSYVQHLIDNGRMTREEAKVSNVKSWITRCVGTEKTVDPDLFTYDVTPGSYAVLCSDGLTNHVEPTEICDIVDQIGVSGDIQNACESLINCANSRGGSDNITAVVLSM